MADDEQNDETTPEPTGGEAPKKVWKTGFKYWMDRLKREGDSDRIKRYYELLKEKSQASGKPQIMYQRETMLELGFIGVKQEKLLLEAWEKTDGANFEARVKAEVRRIIGEIKTGRGFEEALNKLPTAAVDPRIEIQWIRNHPAMCRKSRQADPKQKVLLLPGDLNPSHGPAPSRAAAIQLQNWADCPDDFNKNFAFIIKKTDASTDGKATDVVEDMGLDEVRRLLKQVKKNKEDEPKKEPDKKEPGKDDPKKPKGPPA